MIVNKDKPSDFEKRHASHLQEFIRDTGTIIKLATMEEVKYKDKDGIEYTVFIIIAQVGLYWAKISMDEYMKFNVLNAKHIEDIDGNLVFPSELRIVSSTNRLNQSGSEYYYYKAYSGHPEYSKQNGLSHLELTQSAQIPGHNYSLVQDYTVEVVD